MRPRPRVRRAASLRLRWALRHNDPMKISPVSRALRAVVAIVGLSLAGTAQAHEYTLGTLAIGHPHARPTAPGQPTGGGYLTVTNRGRTADRLMGAAAPSVAQAVEV